VAASAVLGVAAARTAAAKIHAKARMRLKSAKRAIGRAEIIFFVPAFDGDADGVGYVSNDGVPRFIVANPPGLCHKPKPHRPADQGLPWRCHCWLFRLGNSQAFSTL
jgi:hypothetical protein